MELAALRKGLNLTQAQFADLLEVSASLIEKVEMGERGMSLKLAKRIEDRTGARGVVEHAVRAKLAMHS